jgi:hypothetical protein
MEISTVRLLTGRSSADWQQAGVPGCSIGVYIISELHNL